MHKYSETIYHFQGTKTHFRSNVKHSTPGANAIALACRRFSPASS